MTKKSMAPWLIPALKTVLPHLGSIVAAAAPVFTRKSSPDAGEELRLLQQQVGELQAAASQNDRHVRELAGQLQRTVTALEDAARLAERRAHRVELIAVTAAVLAAAALLVAVAALLGG